MILGGRNDVTDAPDDNQDEKEREHGSMATQDPCRSDCAHLAGDSGAIGARVAREGISRLGAPIQYRQPWLFISRRFVGPIKR